MISLKGEFESKKGLEIELKGSLARAEATLNAASALLGKLAGEKNRWEGQVSFLTQAQPRVKHYSKLVLTAILQMVTTFGQLDTFPPFLR